jgi:hypothetical protein
MNLAELLTAYNQVAREHELQPMSLARLTLSTRDALLPGPAPQGGVAEDAWQWLRGLAPREGWLQFQSRVEAFAGGELPAPADDWGVLLAAEALLSDGRSLLLRPDGRGTLRATLIEATATEASSPTSGAVLTDRVHHRATGRVPGAARALGYSRYWRMDPERGPAPFLAAFDGFGSPEE